MKLLSTYMKHLKNNNLDKYFSYKTSMKLIFSSKFAKIALSLSIKPNVYFHPFCGILVTKSEVLSYEYPTWFLYIISYLIYGHLIMTHVEKYMVPFLY